MAKALKEISLFLKTKIPAKLWLVDSKLRRWTSQFSCFNLDLFARKIANLKRIVCTIESERIIVPSRNQRWNELKKVFEKFFNEWLIAREGKLKVSVCWSPNWIFSRSVFLVILFSSRPLQLQATVRPLRRLFLQRESPDTAPRQRQASSSGRIWLLSRRAERRMKMSESFSKLAALQTKFPKLISNKMLEVEMNNFVSIKLLRSADVNSFSAIRKVRWLKILASFSFPSMKLETNNERNIPWWCFM